MTVTQLKNRLESWQEAAPSNFERRKADVWAVVAGVAALIMCMWLVHEGDVGDVEEAVFRAFNDLPDVLKAPMWVGQLLGLLVTPLLAAALFAWLRRYRLALLATLLVPLKLFFERSVVKALVERERPFQILSGVAQRDDSTAGLSFPSGHAILAFGLAWLIAPYLTRRWQLVAFALALFNGVARVYLGAHNPLDIVGGAALGVAIAGALNLALGAPSRRE